MERPPGEKKDATENIGIEDNGMDNLQEKKDEKDKLKNQGDFVNIATETERKGIKKEDNGPGLEKKINSQCTDIRKDMEKCNNVNNDMGPDITHSNTEKAMPASDEMKPALGHVEQNTKELIHSTL